MNYKEYLGLGSQIIENLKKCNKNIILYGIGSIGNFVYGALREYVDISCYCVSDNATCDKIFNGLPVYEVSKIPFQKCDCRILLTLDSRHWTSAQIQLADNDFTDVDPFSVDNQNGILSYYYRDLFLKKSISIDNEILDLNGVQIRNPLLLGETDLKAVFIELNDLLMWDILNDYSLLSEGPYLYGNIVLQEKDVVFDCGSNLGLFSCIAASKNCISYAFEPTERLYNDLYMYEKIYNNRIIPCNYALSDTTGIANFAVSDIWDVANTLVVDEENTIVSADGYKNFVEVKTITIDDFVRINNIHRVDFIKADIEGAERYMLKGAKDTLARFSPKLAICTYHFKDDPDVLEKLILEANPNYIIEHKWKKLYAYVKK